LVVGTLILKRKFSNHGKQLAILCFSSAGFLFLWEHYQRTGCFGGVYGYQIMDYLNAIIGSVGLWTVLAASILYILF
jgi:S-DNA-T family DNA segregation ATPase FtsK/SpoIIIE